MHHWKALDLDITDFIYYHDPTPSSEFISSQTSNLKLVKITKVSDKPTFDAPLESSWFGNHRF